jgi:hypothetical protein
MFSTHLEGKQSKQTSAARQKVVREIKKNLLSKTYLPYFKTKRKTKKVGQKVFVCWLQQENGSRF